MPSLRIHTNGGHAKELTFESEDDARRYLEEIRKQTGWILLKGPRGDVIGQIPVLSVSLIELVRD